MKKLSIFVMMFACAVLAQSGGGKPKIAVYVTGGQDVGLNRALSTRLLEAFVNSKRYTAVERSDAFTAELDREQDKQRSGAIDDEQISRLGKQSGVQFVCVADITHALGSYQVSARIIDVESANVVAIGVADSPLKTIEDLAVASRDIIAALFRGTAPPQPPPAMYTFTVNAKPSEGGTVSRSPNQERYTAGSVVTVTATPAPGYRFGGWSGASISTSSKVTLTVGRDMTLTANFIPQVLTFSLVTNVHPLAGGTITRDPSNQPRYKAGEQVTLTAVPARGYRFVGWTSGKESFKDEKIVVRMDRNRELTARFRFVPTYSLETVIDPPGGGTITRTPDQPRYDAGTKVALKAVPEQGYRFVGWTSGTKTFTNPDVVFTITENREFVANFQAVNETAAHTYVLTTRSDPPDGGTIIRNPDQPRYNAGTKVVLMATPTEGYRFTGWTSGTTTHVNAAILFNMDSDVEMVANFKAETKLPPPHNYPDDIDDLLDNLMTRNRNANNLNLQKRGDFAVRQPSGFQAGGSLTGDRARPDIARVITQNLPTLRHVYNRRLAVKPGLKGIIAVKFAIDWFGTVMSANLVSSTVNDSELESMVVSRVKTWNFGRIDNLDDVTEVVYTFAFSEEQPESRYKPLSTAPPKSQYDAVDPKPRAPAPAPTPAWAGVMGALLITALVAIVVVGLTNAGLTSAGQ